MAIPLLVMLLMPAWAMIDDAFIGSRGSSFLGNQQWLLLGFAVGTLGLELWMIVEAILMFPALKGVREEPAPPPGDWDRTPDLTPSELP